MADLKKYKIYKNNNFEILTDEGFKDFDGIIIGNNLNKILLEFEKNDIKTKIVCTPKHKIFIGPKKYKYAKNLNINDLVWNGLKITNKKIIKNNEKIYEILNVHDNHRYIVNKTLLCHQCLIIDEMAHIPEHLIKDFWNSVIPVISSHRGTKIICVSTPNGTGNMFHKIYTESERGELQQWHHERIDWWEIPGRGKKWKIEMMEALAGENKNFEQEFGNCFLETGQSAVDAELLNHFREIARKPKITLEDGHYKIWEYPNPEHLYVVGVDVSEGIGRAASVAQVLDITNLADIKQSACYHNNVIDPYHFAAFLNNMGNQWGRPFLLIERNNCGGQVIDALQEVHNYQNIVDHTPEKQKKYYKYYNKLGIYSHSNSKYKGVVNMRYWMNSLRVVSIYDVATTQELETFVKYPNGTWKKKSGDYIYDDRVFGLLWALFALETQIAEQYFDVVSYDERGKPKKIQSIVVEAPKYFKLDPMFQNDIHAPLPAFIGINQDIGDEDDIITLQKKGWKELYDSRITSNN